MQKAIVSALILAVAWVVSGCVTASVDSSQAKAQTGAPEVAQVEPITIPRDAAFPTYVVAVEPFNYSASGTVSGGHPADHFGHFSRGDIGPGVSAQLVTALTKSYNIQVVELNALTRNADGTYSTSLQEGEIGPIIIRGTVTEFNETADLSGEKTGGSLLGAGAIMGIAGAVTGQDVLTTAGAGVAAANPSFENKKMNRQGMVAMDVKVVDGRNNRLAGGFTSAGTFATVSANSGFSLFGIGKSAEAYAASALGQATRAAMNDTVQQATETLKNRYPKGE